MHAYIVLSLLAGIRTEEARALHWTHIDLDGDPAASPPVPPHIAVWRSVRTHGDTKTQRSRRTLGLPAAAVQALRAWAGSQAAERLAAGNGWQDTGLVFTSHHGAALDAANVRKMFKRVCTEARIGDGWTPRELRTSFVSLLSHRGVSWTPTDFEDTYIMPLAPFRCQLRVQTRTVTNILVLSVSACGCSTPRCTRRRHAVRARGPSRHASG